MNLQLFIELGGFVILLAGIIWSTAFQKGKSETVEENMNNKIDSHIQDDERVETSLKNQMQKLWDWKDQNQKDDASMQLELQRQIGKVESSVAIQAGQYGEILRLISSMQTSLTSKIDKMEQSIKEISKN